MHTIAKQKDFLSQLIQHLNSSGRGLDYTTTYTYVYTLENNPVLARIHTITQPYSDYEYSYINEEIARFPSVVELREPTMSYNCHSYAWYSQSENNIYWIDEPGSFLTDKTRIVNDWQIGDKIVYSKNGEVTHSGIITAVNGNTLSTITVISKWGSYGLYQHIGNDCLYTEGENITYTVYRLCTHSPNTYIRTQTNVYVHKAECPSCGYITSEDHVLDIRGFCTLCGGKGINIDFNSIKEGEENQ